MALAMLVAGCSGEKQSQQPTEQELHAADAALSGSVKGRHLVGCKDGGDLLVDFKDQGLALEIRENAADRPLVLTAPAQGLQYIGDTASATFKNGELRLQAPPQPERI